MRIIESKAHASFNLRCALFLLKFQKQTQTQTQHEKEIENKAKVKNEKNTLI